ncbi:hypothetical protein NUM3379_20540 [Kineococcus sp. NUM-3379]
MSGAGTSAGVFAGGGETGRIMADLDWAATPVGPVASWPQSLRSAVRLVLSSRYPMLLFWGPRFTQVYNDAYSQLIGDKHPAALGEDVRVTLAEGWDALGPIIDETLATGVASWVPSLLLLLERSGYREEAYFSVSHAAARDDDGEVAGIFTVCSEVTEQVVGERRLRLLRELSTVGGDERSVQATASALVAAMTAPLDVPLAALYLREGAVLRRVGVSAGHGGGLPEELPLQPQALPAPPGASAGAQDPWGLLRAAAGQRVRLDGVGERVRVPGGPFGDPVRTAVALPVPSADRDLPLGVLLAGTSASRELDDAYSSFLELLAQQVSVSLRNALAHEEERARAEALAELDRVKTSFFTNVSHEFRTPLTLMLAPLADALEDAGDPLSPQQRERVETARRNAARMTKLVDDLLRFSSIEAGRLHLAPQEVDLAALTADLAAAFRSAVERVDLALEVDCPPLPGPVSVDPDSWERIVVNLLSNALKFTFVGSIRVSLRADGDGVVLEVADTGIGIPQEEQPRLFDRFSRVHGARSRSHEGTGIGLALVAELTRLHGGGVGVRSRPGEGTTFTVRLPAPALPAPVPTAAPGAARAASPVVHAALEEVAGWGPAPATAPGAAGPEPQRPGPQRPAPRDPARGREDTVRVLVVDDNADMRGYLVRLLRAEGWLVESAADGEEALRAIATRRLDVVLSDVMMPGLDGFQLVHALRSDPATETLPVVLLSARAGQEAGVEGLEAGADDYVVKPFTAPDLLARLRATVRLARLRTSHEARVAALADTAAVVASGRALAEAAGLVVEQARVLLRGSRATARLDGGDGPALVFTSPQEPGDPAGPVGAAGAVPAGAAGAVRVTEPVTGRDGRVLGDVEVEVPARPTREERLLLRPVAHLLAALAEGAWRLERGREVALALQRSLLPERLPEVEGLELAARYLPAAPGRDPRHEEAGPAVGGDWYDAVRLPDGRLAVVIGDVEGRGVHAATVMAQLRTAVRTCLLAGLAPGQVLDRAESVLELLGTPVTCTAFVACVGADGSVEHAGAGHPPPLLHVPGAVPGWLGAGPGGEVPAADPPLGAGFGVARGTSRAHLPPGAALLLYTDGLVEDRERQLERGTAELLRRGGRLLAGGGAPADVVTALLAAVEGAVEGAAAAGCGDDVAVLLLRRVEGPPERAAGEVLPVEEVLRYPSTLRAPSAARRDLRRLLGAARVADDVVDELLVAVSEAVNNAVEHALAPSRPEVEVHLRVGPDRVRVTVQDFGSWRERRSAMDRGRGSALMRAVGEVRVVSTATGTAVTIERVLR